MNTSSTEPIARRILVAGTAPDGPPSRRLGRPLGRTFGRALDRRLGADTDRIDGIDGERLVTAAEQAIERAWPASLIHHCPRGPRGLAAAIEAVDPDLIIAIGHPACARLDRLRRRRPLVMPVLRLGAAEMLALNEPESAGALRARVDLAERALVHQPDDEAVWPVRRRDSFFVHNETAAVAQEIGVVFLLDAPTGGGPFREDRLADLLTDAMPRLIALRRRYVSRGPWRRMGWVTERAVDVQAHLHTVTAGPQDPDGRRAIDEFWSRPLPRDRPLWAVLLIKELPAGRTVMAVKMHHALGDGLSAIGTLTRLMPRTDRQTSPRRSRLKSLGRGNRVTRTLATVRGLAELAFNARAPRSPVNRPLSTPGRAVATIGLPADQLRQVARTLHARTSELVLALIAEALHRTVVQTHDPQAERLRALLPVSVRVESADRTWGNWTGAASIDLPVGPMPLRERIDVVRQALTRTVNSGQPLAAELAMRMMAAFPTAAHAWMAARVYNSTFFNVVVSYVPSMRQPRMLLDSRVLEAYPVVPLADGVPLGVAAIELAGRTGFGICVDESGVSDADKLADALRNAFTDLRAEIGS